ncbi:MAG TPA: hypothetical protein VM223_01590, partial [Planctomycetota bacterium]|nr:hypothetical protein [Planctomycetota bacterium]
PRGLEFIYTAETMAAIVRADSDMGMAKAAGRALRTLARLARKLEGAVQEGDEVRVPGWEEGDDRELAEGIVDALASVSYFQMRGGEGTGEVDLLLQDAEQLMASFDADVRAAVPVMVAQWNRAEIPDGCWTRLREAAARPRQDPDPVVRACCLYALGRVYAHEYRPELLRLQADLAGRAGGLPPECRFALAMTAGPQIVEKLRADANAAVRFAAWQRWQKQSLWISSGVIYGPDQNPPALQASGAASLADANPILKSLGPLCMTFGLGWGSRNMAKVSAVARMIADGKDPWLKAAVDGSAPLIEAVAACRADATKCNPAAAMAGIVALATSGKRSHQALALASVVAGKWAVLEQCSGFERLLKFDASPVASLGESDYLWARIAGIAANGWTDGEEPQARIGKALRSDAEIDRLAGLLACAMLGLNDRGPAPSPEVRAAMQASFDSAAYAESALAAWAIGRTWPVEKAFPLLQSGVQHSPRISRTRILLQAALGSGRHPASFEWRKRIQDLLLESADPNLQRFLLRVDDQWAGNDPLLSAMIERCRPELLAWLLSDLRMAPRLKAPERQPVVTYRILAMAGDQDAATRAMAARALASYLAGSGDSRDKQHKQQLLQVAADVLAPCFADGARDDQVAAGFSLATAMLAGHGPLGWPDNLGWMDIPPEGRAAVIRALSWANEPPHSRPAAELLALLCSSTEGRRALEADPKLKKAAEDARVLFTADGSPEDQAVVLCGMASQPEAAAELQKRFLAGGVPPDLQPRVVQSLWRENLTDEFKQALMKIVTDAGARPQLRMAALNLLRGCRELFEDLLDQLALVARNERPSNFQFCLSLDQGVSMNLKAAKEQGDAQPAWRGKAADLGLMVVRDNVALITERYAGIRIYVTAADTAAEGEMVKMVLNSELDPRLRQQAWSAFARLSGRTDIYARLAERYADLGWLDRMTIAQAATEHTNVQGADAFIVRFLKDPNHEAFRKRDLLEKLQAPLTPALLTALKELADDAAIGPQAKSALERCEAGQQKEGRRATPAKP